MTNLAIWVSEPYTNDELFKLEGPLNRDNCLAGFRSLQEELLLRGSRCHTYDIYIKENRVPDIVLFLDIPKKNLKSLLGNWSDRVLKYVILQEPPTVLPRNWDFNIHQQFDTIFTWNDSLVDTKKYLKINYVHNFTFNFDKDLSQKNKLCALIAANKTGNHPMELYSERVRAIRWFENNHPKDFDLYGIGWDEYTFKGPRPIRILNRIYLLKRFLARNYPSYRGTVKRKQEVLKKYKFSICYENIRDLPGYISEKIFDCFFAGCVPVYWGACNITDHIPEGCFIDRRKYDSYEELYNFITTMTDATYMEYLECIEKYLSSAQAHEFTIDCFASTIANEIIHG